MKKLLSAASFIFIGSILSACSTTKNDQPAIDPDTAPTGYWYLSDDGVKHWRSIQPGQIPPPPTPVHKKYDKDVGNGNS